MVYSIYNNSDPVLTLFSDAILLTAGVAKTLALEGAIFIVSFSLSLSVTCVLSRSSD